MRIILRGALSLIVVLVAAFCCFGFLASTEAAPPASNAFRLLYGAAVVACIVALLAVWRVKPGGR